MKRLKVLVSAYYCEPGQGSEEGVGWNLAREIAKYHEVWVLTRTRNSSSIEAERARNGIPNLHFVYFDLHRSVRWWARGQLLEWHLYYYVWQVGIYLRARRLHHEVGFDVVHHVTFVKYWIPSFLALLSVPFVWGPVGGGETAPKAFWRNFSLRGKIHEILRDMGRRLGEHDPFVRVTARRSVLARATTEETAVRMRKLGARNVQVFSQLGLPEEEVDQLGLSPASVENTLRFISIGRLVHVKGFYLGLQAFAKARLPTAEYWVVGDGPERRRLETLTRKLGIEKQVRFWGSLPRRDTLAKLEQSHVLVHPSLKDSGAVVCLEAMAAGRPVICLNLGGPAVQLTRETGIKVPASDPEQTIRDLADAITRLAQDPELRTHMGSAGRRRVREVYSWETKGRLWAELYEEVLG